jgi:hypothetical protein
MSGWYESGSGTGAAGALFGCADGFISTAGGAGLVKHLSRSFTHWAGVLHLDDDSFPSTTGWTGLFLRHFSSLNGLENVTT